MGASVEVFAESAWRRVLSRLPHQQRRNFRGDKLSPGLYTIRSPSRISSHTTAARSHQSNLTTMVRIEMESMFASLEQLRRQPNSAKADADDWSGCCAQRQNAPDLQWDENAVLSANGDTAARAPKFCWSLRMVHRTVPGSSMCTIL